MGYKYSVTKKDESLIKLVKTTDHIILAKWSIDCVERVLPYFEEKYKEDNRPRKAIKLLQKWIDTGIFKMTDIRKAALDAHAAAREVGEDNEARSVARAAGQALATAHVPTHSISAANYALQSIYRSTNPSDSYTTVTNERNWQYQHLLELRRTWSKNQT